MGSGGKGGSSSGGANDYFGDCAGIVCAGPVDRLMAIYVDGRLAWGGGAGLAAAGQPNPVALTISGYGQAFFYWGTEDQTLDTVQEKLLASRGHPNYRGLAVLVIKSFLFGREKVSAPSIEVIVRRKPRQTVVTGPAAELDADGQANPICVIAELITNPVFGIGRSPSILHQASWQAIADDLYARASETYISPVLERAQPTRALIDDIRSYYDGWFRRDEDGLIRAGRFPHNEAPPEFTADNTITAKDLIEEPSLESGPWSETFNEVEVKFNAATNYFKDTSVTVTSGYNRAIVKEPRHTQLDRPFITRPAQASGAGAEYLKVVSEPRFSGKLKVRARKAAFFPVGTIFRLDLDLLRVAMVCRVVGTEDSAPPEESVRITFEAERGLTARPVFVGGLMEEEEISEDAEIITRAQFMQPPAEFFAGQNRLLVVLAARANPITAGCAVHFRQSDEAIYQELGVQGGFAVQAKFTADYAATTGDDTTGLLQLELSDPTLDTDLERVTSSQSDDEVADLHVCLFAFRASNPREFEIMSVRQLSSEVGVWTATVRRGMAGTDPLDFKAGDSIWFINRSEIVAYRHEAFGNTEELPGYFRLQSYSVFGVADIAQCPDFTHVVSPAAPANITKFSIEGLRLSWSLVPGLEIAGYQIRRQSGTRRTWEDAVPVHEGLLLSSPFQLSGLPSGTNTLLIKAVDVYGAESVEPAFIVTALGDAVVANVLEEWDQRTADWAGTITGGYIDGADGPLVADSTENMWSVDPDTLAPIPNAPMWTSGATNMWADELFTSMTYEFRVTTGSALAGLRLTIQSDISGDPNNIFYREADTADMWSATSTDPMWGEDDQREMWSVGPWQPWTGALSVAPNGSYDFRVVTGGGQVQGRIDELTAVIDVADVTQNVDNFAVSSGGTRIPLTKTFNVLKVVNLTLQDSGGTAVTAKWIDKDPVNGPLIKCFDAAGTAVAGNVDAILQGY